MSNNKLIIISIDALNAKDFDTLKTLPVFKLFIDKGAYVPHVSSVYPSVTYTCHTSIATGHYPYAHGVYNNELPQPHKPTTQDWRWFESSIKSPTLFDYANQSGLTSAAILWPVMGDSEIKWNVPELWAPDDSLSGLRLFWRHGSRNLLLPVILYSHLLDGKKQPALDNFTEAVTRHIIKYKDPDITAIHLTELDTVRHIYGLNSQEATQALKGIEKRLERIIRLTKDQGNFKNTNFVLLGDHGSHDFDAVVSLNRYFVDHGFMTTDLQSNISSWQAYACTCGGSCQIHLAEGLEPAIVEAIDKALRQLKDEDNSPIKAILTKDEALEDYQLSGDFQWVVEAEDPYTFTNALHPNLITPASHIPGSYRSDHGYRPEHPDMATMLFMMGPDIKKGGRLDHCSIVDEGPTFARLVGLEMAKTDGQVLESLLI